MFVVELLLTVNSIKPGMPISITAEQLQEYQARIIAAVATSAAGGGSDDPNNNNNNNSNNDTALADAIYWSGYCHEFGTGGIACNIMGTNRSQAVEIWSRVQCLHTQDNTGRIFCRLAMGLEVTPMFGFGGGATQNPRAKQLFLLAIPRLQYEATHLEDSESQLLLGRCWSGGHVTGVKDHLQALYWYHKAADQGHVDAQQEIARCYQYGWGVDKDFVKAVEWFDKAVSQGDRMATESRQSLIRYTLPDDKERERVLGCVQRNQYIQKIISLSSPPPQPLGVWALALAMLANQTKWAGLSPSFLCLSHIMPQLRDDMKQNG